MGGGHGACEEGQALARPIAESRRRFDVYGQVLDPNVPFNLVLGVNERSDYATLRMQRLGSEEPTWHVSGVADPGTPRQGPGLGEVLEIDALMATVVKLVFDM